MAPSRTAAGHGCNPQESAVEGLVVLMEGADVYLDYEDSDWPVPCDTCLHWHSDVVLDETGLRVLREWHHPDCPTYRQWA